MITGAIANGSVFRRAPRIQIDIFMDVILTSDDTCEFRQPFGLRTIPTYGQLLFPPHADRPWKHRTGRQAFLNHALRRYGNTCRLRPSPYVRKQARLRRYGNTHSPQVFPKRREQTRSRRYGNTHARRLFPYVRKQAQIRRYGNSLNTQVFPYVRRRHPRQPTACGIRHSIHIRSTTTSTYNNRTYPLGNVLC